MLTTIEITDQLLGKANRVAASEQISLEELVEAGLREVLSTRGRPSRPPDASRSRVEPDPASPALAALTEREREVVVLLVSGCTNRQIASDLCLVTKTVEKRMSSILSKLGFEHRSQVAAWAVAQGLAPAPADLDARLWTA